jgi:lipopolysaccharide transport system ATP-binding protein
VGEDLVKMMISPERSNERMTAIAVNQISKLYPLYAKPSDRLKQSLWYALPAFLRGQPPEFYQEFWALREASFQIQRGETVGIIGRNGSGKSTLLQIIAGTLTPTDGEVQIRGQVAALLELGSGFNPEFTGRENVYMNGSILGMSVQQIDEIYVQIVDFADIGPFIDQPVKFYSSGMFVRLAFAVQAFVPKEILIVDEALSVGDAAFQRKCMLKLEQFRDSGGTVLLVSHDTQTIVRQCQRCLLLSYGKLILDGPSKLVTDVYQKILYSTPDEETKILEEATQQTSFKPVDVVSTNSITADWFDPNLPQTSETSYTNGAAEITGCGFYNEASEQVNVLVAGRRYSWVYTVEFFQSAKDVTFGMMIKTTDGIDVAGVATDKENIYFEHIPASSKVEIGFSLKLNLVPGNYFLNSGVFGEATYLHRRVDIAMIRVIPCDNRESYGLAYLEPQVTVSNLSNPNKPT